MATREEIAEAFKAAKALTAIDAGGCTVRFEFICHALKRIALPGAKAAADIIYDRFANEETGDTTIYAWLNDVAQIPYGLLTNNNVQAYKHRWLDSVIEEFSTKE